LAVILAAVRSGSNRCFDDLGVPRMLRNAPRIAAGCAAIPGPMVRRASRGSRLNEAVLRTASRPGHVTVVLHPTKKPPQGLFQIYVIPADQCASAQTFFLVK
jgi:hypothetical protein